MIAINCGSGQRPFDQSKGWINVDKIAHEGMPVPDVIADGASLPFPDEYADYVCLHHVLEHFGCGEGRSLIAESHRVLKSGGSLLVFVPDMGALARRWLDGAISTQIYLTNVYGAYMGHEEDRHRWGFEWHHLSELLQSTVAWKVLKPWNSRKIPGADIAWDWWILGMEAIK